MASVNLSGVLLNPEGEPDVGAVVKFTLLTTTGETVSSSTSELIIPPDGTYNIDIVYGVLRVDYISDFKERFVAITTVNGDTVATSLPELLNAVVPPTNAQLLQFQAILADTVTAKNAAELAETGAVAAEATLLAEKLTTVELISLSNTFAVGSVITTLGYTTAGDGGAAQLVKTATTGTASQSPAQLGDAKIADSTGSIWDIVYADTLNIKQLGGDLGANNGGAVFAFNASNASTLDLCGEEWPAIDIDCDNATDRAKLLKNFINGSLITFNSFDAEVNIQTLQNSEKDQIRVSGRKTEVLTWKDKRVLWLGTSIPHQGVGFDGYPEQFASLLDCTVLNWAWSGSHAFYDVAGDAFDINTTKSLSMTEADRLAGLATYGASSAYSDTFDVINKPSEMTADYRIKNQFIAGAVDVVILDHNHNDRKLTKTYTANPKTISNVTKGATTVVTVASTTGYAVGGAAYLNVTGIANLNFAAARISAVTSTTVTLDIDSSGYAGSFATGTLNFVDRTTIEGAFDFLIAYTKNMGIIYGNESVDIVLCNSPSYFTNNVNRDYSIWSSGKAIKAISEKWGLGYYDVAADLDLDYSQHLTYFPDAVHPSTKETRVSMANHWAAWCSGGKQSVINRADVVEKNKLIPDSDDAPVLYSRFDGKYAAREYIFDLDADIINDDFSGGIGTWTVVSTAPVIGAAPWDGAEFAAQFNPTVIAASPYITKSCAAGFEPRLQFSFYIPDTDIATGASQQMTIADLTAGATNYGIGVVQSAGSDMRLRVFRTDTNIAYAGINNFIIQPNTKYEVVVDIIKGATDSDDGYIYISVNGVDIVANQFDNGGVGSITSLRIGSVFNNFASAFNFYISDIVATSKTRSETPQWFHAIDSMPAQFNTFAQAQAAGLTKTNQRIIVVERGNANYILQASGYVALAGDLTLSNGRVAALQINPNGMDVKSFGLVFDDVITDAFSRLAGVCKIIIADPFATNGKTFTSVSDIDLEFTAGGLLTLNSLADAHVLEFVTSTNIKILNPNINGNRANQTVTSGGSAKSGIYFESSSGIRINSGNITGCAGSGIRGRNASNMKCVDVTVTDSGYRQIYIAPSTTAGLDCYDIEVLSCTVSWADTADSSITNQPCISVTNNGPSLFENVRVSNCLVTQHADNVTASICIEGGGITGLAINANECIDGDLGISWFNCSDFTVNGNPVITGGNIGIECANRNINGTISNNPINGLSALVNGIAINGALGICENITLSGNNIKGVVSGITAFGQSLAVRHKEINLIGNNVKCVGGGKPIELQWVDELNITSGILDGLSLSSAIVQLVECDNFAVVGTTQKNIQTFAIDISSAQVVTINSGHVSGNKFDLLAGNQQLNYVRNSLFAGSTIVDVTVSANSRGPSFTSYANNILNWSGTGTPESSITAGIGSQFIRTNGGAGTTFYIKESGTGNTGWVGK